MLLSEQAYQRIDRELTKFPDDQRRSAILAALAIAQEEKGWVSTEAIEDVAADIGVPPIQVQEVATFYGMFHLEPVGSFTTPVCTNLRGALRDGGRSGESLKEKRGIDYGETSADGLFTLEETACMGSCGDAPIVLVNNQHMCLHMQEERIDLMLQELRKEGESA